MAAQVDWEGMIREGIVGLGKIAAKGLRAGVDSVAEDAEKMLVKAEKRTRKFRSALQKAMAETTKDD